MRNQRNKFIAALALVALVGFMCSLVIMFKIFSEPDGWNRFAAWRTGGTFLGKEGVVFQNKHNNCGPAALKMVFDHYGIHSTLTEIEQQVKITERGSSMLALKEMAELKGLKAEGWRYTLDDFMKCSFPIIVFVHGDHYVVADSVDDNGILFLRNPALGRLRMRSERLPKIWNGETLVFKNAKSNMK